MEISCRNAVLSVYKLYMYRVVKMSNPTVTTAKYVIRSACGIDRRLGTMECFSSFRLLFSPAPFDFRDGSREISPITISASQTDSA